MTGNPRNQPGRGKATKVAGDIPTRRAEVEKRTKQTKPATTESQWSAYCIKDKKKMPLLEPHKDKFSNGTKVIKGKCAGCGNTLTQIVKGAIWDNFEE